MDKLPKEIVLRIAELLSNDEDVGGGQAALSKLSRASKSFHSLANPVLYRHPKLLDIGPAEEWGTTYGACANPWSLMEMAKGKDKIRRPGELTFSLSNPPHPYDDHTPIPDSCYSLGVFNNLTSLVIRRHWVADFVPRVLSPLSPLRRTLINLVTTLDEESWMTGRMWRYREECTFVFELLKYVDVEHYTFVLDRLEDDEPHSPQGESWEVHSSLSEYDEDGRTATNAEIAAAKLDWDAFHSTLHPEPPVRDSQLAVASMRSQPPSNHPFVSLRSFEINLDAQPESLFSLFLTGILPALKHLKITGEVGLVDVAQLQTFRAASRRSITRDGSSKHGQVLPLLHVHLFDFAPTLSSEIVLSSEWWKPLSSKEVKDYGESRCPELEVLDISGLLIELMGA